MFPVNLDFWNFHFRGYEGHWALLTLVLGFFYQRAKSVKQGYSREWFVSAYTFAIMTGFVTARIFHFAFWDTAAFLRDPLVIVRPGGGFAILGATIGTGFGGWVYCRLTGVNFLHWCDGLMTPICLCLALGRLSCFLNGDAYGLPSAVPWAVQFSDKSVDWMGEWLALHKLYADSPEPLRVLQQIFGQYVTLQDLPLPASLASLSSQGVHSVGDLARFYPPQAHLTQAQLAGMGLFPFPVVTPRVHPAQIYEFLIMLGAYFFIMYAEKQDWGRQRAFYYFWVIYGANRFIVEIFRGDRNIAFASMTYAQVIALLLIAGGAAGIIYCTKKWEKNGLPEVVLK